MSATNNTPILNESSIDFGDSPKNLELQNPTEIAEEPVTEPLDYVKLASDAKQEIIDAKQALADAKQAVIDSKQRIKDAIANEKIAAKEKI